MDFPKKKKKAVKKKYKLKSFTQVSREPMVLRLLAQILQ